MARVSKVDTCMICESVPCRCFEKPKVVKPKKAPAPRAATVTETVEPVPSSAPRVSVRDRMRTAASTPAPPLVVAPTPPPAPPTVCLAPPSPTQAPVEHELDAARRVTLRVLAKTGLLSANDRRKYSQLLTSPPALDERIENWKRHHGNQD